jgi:arylsulfatase
LDGGKDPVKAKGSGARRGGRATGERDFTGKIEWVQIDVDEAAEDHLISPEERLRVALARQ